MAFDKNEKDDASAKDAIEERLNWVRRWTKIVLRQLARSVEHEEVIQHAREEGQMSGRFVFMVIISVIVMLNHCYYGYNASGGPVGVGEAVGRSMRASLIAIVLVVLFASLALYGTDPNFNLTV